MTALLLLLLIASVRCSWICRLPRFSVAYNRNATGGELAAQQARYEQDSKQWNDYCEKIKTQYQSVVNKYNEDAKRWKEYFASLKTENERLSKWKNVADAEIKATEMVRTARANLEKAKTDANSMTAAAQQQATALLAEADQKAQSQLASVNETANTVASEAKAKAKALKDEAQAILNSATGQAAKIIDAANKKAEEIGGNAYEAMKNAALYEQTVKAMKNLIDGYGDQYIIPQQSLLDDLADDFSHTQAGQELKRAREATKVMIRNGTAATCEYVEANRRETAINFVVDAFNGKVDSILSRVKHDNAGKLEQQVRDAYTLVNYNGKAFRDARITEEFLAARLDELKWAAIAQQLAMEEREEQRRIKEQIREEARAGRSKNVLCVRQPRKRTHCARRWSKHKSSSSTQAESRRPCTRSGFRRWLNGSRNPRRGRNAPVRWRNRRRRATCISSPTSGRLEKTYTRSASLAGGTRWTESVNSGMQACLSGSTHMRRF